jgi:hypothetical protein
MLSAVLDCTQFIVLYTKTYAHIHLFVYWQIDLLQDFDIITALQFETASHTVHQSEDETEHEIRN